MRGFSFVVIIKIVLIIICLFGRMFLGFLCFLC